MELYSRYPPHDKLRRKIFLEPVGHVNVSANKIEARPYTNMYGRHLEKKFQTLCKYEAWNSIQCDILIFEPKVLVELYNYAGKHKCSDGMWWSTYGDDSLYPFETMKLFATLLEKYGQEGGYKSGSGYVLSDVDSLRVDRDRIHRLYRLNVAD